MSGYEVVPLPSDARVRAGDDLAALLLDAAATAGVTLADGDVVCVASKVVSKAEGAVVALDPDEDPHDARRRLALEQAVRVVADTPWVLVVATRHGFVCANAGIDASNVDEGHALLLPHDPDDAAADLRRVLRERTGADVGVVVTDTFGRPWRLGQTDVALGAAGVTSLRDDRGTTDLTGRTLEVTMVAVADQLAAAADLARRKADGAAFVLVRGLDVGGDGTGRDLVRPADEDVFPAGGPTAVELAVARPAEPLGPEVTGAPPRLRRPDPVERAVAATRDAAGHGRWSGPAGAGGAEGPPWVASDVTDRDVRGLAPVDARVAVWVRPDDPAALVEAGRAVERARLVLEAHGLAVTLVDARALDLGSPLAPAGTLDGARLAPLVVVAGRARGRRATGSDHPGPPDPARIP